jgi:hypothetical protein
MAAQEDSLLSPITAVADSSETTTLLVSKGSGLPRALQQAFDDGACPPPLALLAFMASHCYNLKTISFYFTKMQASLIHFASPS